MIELSSEMTSSSVMDASRQFFQNRLLQAVQVPEAERFSENEKTVSQSLVTLTILSQVAKLMP